MAATNPPMVLDLSGLLYLQQSYLNSVDKNSGDPKILNTIQGQLNGLYNDLNVSNVSTSQVLDHQIQMSNIVETEQKRLELKKKSIDDALVGKKRSIELNDNYRLRYAAYTKMIIVLVIALVIYILLTIVSRLLPFLPSILFDILTAVLITGTIIILYVSYTDYKSRDTLYYNQLNLSPPKNGAINVDAQSAAANLSNTSYLLTSSATSCSEKTCCDEENGVKWNEDSQKCEKDTFVYSAADAEAKAALKQAAPTSSGLWTSTQGFEQRKKNNMVSPNQPLTLTPYK